MAFVVDSMTSLRASQKETGCYHCPKMPGRAEIYQIKVTLRDSRPPIWRRIQVQSDITFADLHSILQCVMGWDDAHLHQFIVRGKRYGPPDKEDIGPRNTRDERKHALSELVSGAGSLRTTTILATTGSISWR